MGTFGKDGHFGKDCTIKTKSPFSKIPKTVSCFLKDIDPILPNSHFMLSHIPDFQELIWRIGRMFQHASSRTFSKFPISHIFKCPTIIFYASGISWINWSHLEGPNSNIVGFGSHGHHQISPNNFRKILNRFWKYYFLNIPKSFWKILILY